MTTFREGWRPKHNPYLIAITVTLATFMAEKRGMAFALYGMAVVVAPAIGPTLGGWITDNFNWHWIFFINIPIGALSLFLTSRLVEDPPWIEKGRRSAARVDYIGLAL